MGYESEIKADSREVRRAVRLSTNYFLRACRLVSDVVGGGDLTRGMIFLAIVEANISHIDSDPELSHQFGLVETVPPDAMRRPVSVLAIARSLGLSYETTRRHVLALMEAGFCERRDGGGIVAPTAALARPELAEALEQNYRYLQLLVRRLQDDRRP